MKTSTKIVLAIVSIFLCGQVTEAQVIPINQTFNSDTIIIPFSGTVPVYSLTLSGGVNLYSDSSLVRVILIDTYGNHHMVFESYPLITQDNAFDTISASDETTFLDGVICDSLRIDIINTVLVIDSLKIDTAYNPDALALQTQAKWNHDSIKIEIMNQRIVEEHMYWRAGRSNLTQLNNNEKEKLFSKKYALEGFDYFVGGIFHELSLPLPEPRTAEIVETFSWCDRHDSDKEDSYYFNDKAYGWVSIPNQQEEQTCYAFAAIGLAEAYSNLYFNNNIGPNGSIKGHQVNLCLSEMQIIKCQAQRPCITPGPLQDITLQWMTLNYVVDSVSYPMNCPTSPLPCPTAATVVYDKVKFEDHKPIVITSPLTKDDTIKTTLIKYGPLSYYHLTSNYKHQMLLVGYKLNTEGDTVYFGNGNEDPPIILDENCPLLGTTKWTFIDSYLNDFIDYSNVTYMDPDNTQYFIGEIDRPLFTTPIRCTDEDGDGYYWWGVHWEYNPNTQENEQLSPQECNCPAGVKVYEEDCNDNDPTVRGYATSQNNPNDQPLYSCIPNEYCTTQIDQLIISVSDEWTIQDGDRHYNQDIVIKPGVELIIHCQVFLSPLAKIIIEPGGKLNLNGTFANPARISSACGEFWKGIQIWGDPTLPQTGLNQGKVQITNGIIENAVCGIMTGNPDYTPDGGGQWEPYPVFPSGGIIQAEQAKFINNLVDVIFYPYRRFYENGMPEPNISWFQKCTFLTSNQLLDDLSPQYHVSANGVNEVKFRGCIFENTRTEATPYSERGTGVFSNNSQVKFEKTLFSSEPCRFENMRYGIYSLYSGQGPTALFVKECEMNGNQFGLYAGGHTQAAPIDINGCTVNINKNFGVSEFYGVYLDNCTGFDVRQNYFSSSSFLTDTYGVVVNNSGIDNNYIYDNYFEHLTYGLQGLNINRNSDAAIEGGVPVFIPTGLRFICNKFHDVGCTSDFLINEDLAYPLTQPGIAYNQRNASNIMYPTQEPAGNTFTLTHDPGDPSDYDINISSTVGNILYTHHTTSDPGWLRVIPVDVSNQDKVGYNPRPNLEYSDSTSCPDNFYPEGNRTELWSAISEANQKTDSLVNLLQILVDEGSTDTLKSTVENSTSVQSYEVFQNLLSASPYLSDTVIKTSIEKEEVLPNAMIRDIMVANPHSAKNEELLNTIDERTDPMPDSMWVEILQGMDTLGAMERLVGELDGWMQRRDLYFNALTKVFLSDSIHSWAFDSLVNLLGSDNHLSSRYLLVQYYLDHFDFAGATGVLQNISGEFSLTHQQLATHQRVLSLVSLFSHLYTDTLNYMVPDSMQIITLEQLADTGYDVPGAWARNILIACGQLNYQESIINESTLKSSRRSQYTWTHTRPITANLKVFPNPTKDFVIVEYRKENMNDKLTIDVLDMKGKKVTSWVLPKTVNQEILPLDNLPAGTYMILLRVNGLPKANQKLILIR